MSEPCKEAAEAAAKIFISWNDGLDGFKNTIQAAMEARDKRTGVCELVAAAKATSGRSWTYNREQQKRVADAVTYWESANAV